MNCTIVKDNLSLTNIINPIISIEPQEKLEILSQSLQVIQPAIINLNKTLVKKGNDTLLFRDSHMAKNELEECKESIFSDYTIKNEIISREAHQHYLYPNSGYIFPTQCDCNEEYKYDALILKTYSEVLQDNYMTKRSVMGEIGIEYSEIE